MRPVKCFFLGSTGVGKTSIIERIKYGEISTRKIPTNSPSFEPLKVKFSDEVVDIQLWDTAGQEKYMSITAHVFRNVSVVFLVFSLDSMDSFNSLESWYKLVSNHCNPFPHVILLGNKCDITPKRVDQNLITHFTMVHHINVYIEVSALDGTRIDEIGYMAVSETRKGKNIQQISKSNVVNINTKKKESNCSC